MLLEHTSYIQAPVLLFYCTATAQLRADLHATGDHVLHLDSDAVLVEEVTYPRMFHLGKPMLPFRRYRSETYEGEQRVRRAWKVASIRWCLAFLFKCRPAHS